MSNVDNNVYDYNQARNNFDSHENHFRNAIYIDNPNGVNNYLHQCSGFLRTMRNQYGRIKTKTRNYSWMQGEIDTYQRRLDNMNDEKARFYANRKKNRRY